MNTTTNNAQGNNTGIEQVANILATFEQNGGAHLGNNRMQPNRRWARHN